MAAADHQRGEGANGQTAALYAAAVRDLAEALSLLQAPGSAPAPPSAANPEPRRSGSHLAQRARELAERTLQ